MSNDFILQIAAAGIPVQECTRHHFKYGPWNFYPKRGIIHRDGSDERLNERGPDAFIAICKKEMDGG